MLILAAMTLHLKNFATSPSLKKTYTTWPDENTEKLADAKGNQVAGVKLQQHRVNLGEAFHSRVSMIVEAVVAVLIPSKYERSGHFDSWEKSRAVVVVLRSMQQRRCYFDGEEISLRPNKKLVSCLSRNG